MVFKESLKKNKEKYTGQSINIDIFHNYNNILVWVLLSLSSDIFDTLPSSLSKHFIGVGTKM